VTRHWAAGAEAFLQKRCALQLVSDRQRPVVQALARVGARMPAGDRAPAQGHERLDQILDGDPGQRDQHIIGPPGSGKTILSQQYVFHNASPDRPAVTCRRLSEPFDKILRYAESSASFDRRVGRSSSMRTWGAR